jgi:hypothetical protein
MINTTIRPNKIVIVDLFIHFIFNRLSILIPKKLCINKLPEAHFIVLVVQYWTGNLLNIVQYSYMTTKKGNWLYAL